MATSAKQWKITFERFKFVPKFDLLKWSKSRQKLKNVQHVPKTARAMEKGNEPSELKPRCASVKSNVMDKIVSDLTPD